MRILDKRITSLLAGLLLVLSAEAMQAQIIPKALSLSAEIGPGLYVGEFNSLELQDAFFPRFGFDFTFGLRYNFTEYFTLVGALGYSNLGYHVGDSVRLKYSANFFGPIGDPTYPGSSVAFTEDNSILISKFLLMAQVHLAPRSDWVPYLTGGIGVINFSARNDSNQQLPENLTGAFDRSAIVIPLGGGTQYFFNDWLSGFVQGNFYINTTDYLDGYAHYLSFEGSPGTPGPGTNPTPSDFFFSLTFGLSMKIYEPSPEVESTPPTPPQAQDTTRPKPPAVPPPPPEAKIPRPTPDDRDGDGLSDADETGRYMTDPDNRDTDGDNVRDPDELFRYNTSPNNPDTDGDGLLDGQEVYVYKTNPLVRDTDRDGLSDGEEVLKYGTNPLSPDSDGDGLYDGIEVQKLGTNPNNRDTDNDGTLDAEDGCPMQYGPASTRGCPP